MNFYFRKRVFVLTIAMMMGCMGTVLAQCGFQANQLSGCAGFYLDEQDTTSGIRVRSTNWAVTLPPGSVPAVLYQYRNSQFSNVMNYPGTVCITMTDTLSNGQPCSVSACNVTVYPKPVLKGALSTHVSCVGDCVFWNDSSVAGTGCSPLSYRIDWGAGSIDTTLPYCQRYASNGTYNFGIEIINSCGCVADTTYPGTILVTAPPSAAFTGYPLTSCTTPLVSTMTVTTPTANTKYLWYVSTGAFTSTPAQANGSSTFVHSYTVGTWNVKLVAIDTLSGCTDSTTHNAYITVGSNPAACFTASDSTGCDQRNITFCPCVNGAQKYLWNFIGPSPGSTTPSTVTNFTNACTQSYFSAPGAYTTQLILFYPGGCTDTLSKTYNFGQIYNLAFNSPDSMSCLIPNNICVTYTGQACAGCTFSWNPPGNTTPTSHTGTCYPISSYGMYTPALTVTDPFGCVVSLVRNNYFNVQPLLACIRKSYQNGNGCANDTVIVTNCSQGGPFASVTWNFPGANIVSQNSGQAKVSYSGIGCNRYTMIIKSLSGCIDTLRDSICIGPKPTIGMALSPPDLCYGSLSLFTINNSLSTDTPTSVLVWPEGIKNGAPTFTIPNHKDSFSYTYPDYGKFGFCFLATNVGCNGDTTCLTAPSDSVRIFAPKPGLSVRPICTNSDSVLFTNNSLGGDSSFWTFNGITYPNANPNSGTFNAVFPQCGVKYGIQLTVIARTDTGPVRLFPPFHLSTDTVVCVNNVFDTVVRPCYGVDFKLDTTKGCYYNFNTEANILLASPNDLVPGLVLWSATAASTPPSPVFSVLGLHGDTINPFLLYLAQQYDVCVQLTYSNGCIDTLCKPKYVDISQPLSSYNLSDTAGCVPFCVQFNNTSVVNAGAIGHFYWNFGDNAANSIDSTNLNPNHCYLSVGQFQACFNIVDTNGCTSTYCRQIQSNSIHANFTETDSVTCTANPNPLNPITYTDSSTGFVFHHFWILPASLGATPAVQGDTTSITEQYTAQGYDSIGMIAVDQFGTCRDTVWKHIHVANPIANYGLPSLSDTFFLCPPALINTFLDSSKNDICKYLWNFGDGPAVDPTQNASHLYTVPGIYPVTEYVTSCHGCVDSVTKFSITIQGPYVHMTANSPGGCPCLPITFTIETYNADSIQVTSNGGIPAFTYLGISPRGTLNNPTFTNVSFLYCGVGDVNPAVTAFDFSHTPPCSVPYYNLIIPIPVDTPTANFSSAVHYCGSDSVCFSNLTTYGAPHAHDSTYLWRFGDGTTDNTESPCHQFPAPGDYSVTLVVVDNVGCGDSITKKVHIPKPPKAIFTVSDSFGCIPLVIYFKDSSVVDDSTSIAGGFWNFGDNVTASTTADTSHNYTIPAIDTAMLVVIDGHGCADTARRILNILSPPAIHVGPNTTICFGDTTTLSGSGSANLLWTTNYNIDNTSSPNPRVWPRVDTSYIFSVGSPTTCYVYDTMKVNVSTVNISLDTATNLCFGQVTVFSSSAQTTHATITNYNWSFGDGASASGQTATHRFNTFGTYSDTLLVTNSLGCKDTVVKPVVIVDIPHAAMSVSDTVICLGAPITVTNLSTAGVSAALSTFYFDMQPDGTPDNTSSPYTYTYPSAGKYHVLLVQMDLNQCLDSIEQGVTVHALPAANFNNDTTCINVDEKYTSSSAIGDGPITFYNWSINGVGQGIDSPSFYHTYRDSGVYNVCLNVKDVYGCKDTICKNVDVFSLPLDTVSPLDTTICAGYSASFNITGLRFDRVQWVPSVWVSNPTGTSVTITPKQTIRYQVYAYYLQCTPKIDTVTIWVIDSVPVSATADPENIVLGLSSNVTSTVMGTIDSIVWDPDSTLNCRNCRNPIATPHRTTTYYATVYYSRNGVVCSNRTSVTITVYQSCDNSLIYIPNTFTPNNDGNNDVFRMRGQGISKINYFRVFDRWGKLVFEADNADNPDNTSWNGGLNNDLSKPENSGVFVYVFEIQCITGQTVTGKGNVTLIR